MCLVTKPNRTRTKEQDLLELVHGEQDLEVATTRQTSTVGGGRGKTLLPDVVALLKSKDAAAAAAADIDGVDASPMTLVEETATKDSSSSDNIERGAPVERTASVSAAEEVAEELAMMDLMDGPAPAEPTEVVAALPVVVSMLTLGTSQHSTNVPTTPPVSSASSFAAGAASSEAGVPGQAKKKKSASRRMKGRTRIVDHTYHEHINDLPPAEMYRSRGAEKASSGDNKGGSGVTTRSSGDSSPSPSFFGKTRGGVQDPFPAKLHRVLDEMERNGHTDIMCWMPHGRCFMVKDPKEFVKEYMPTYFNQHKFASFQRQLNLYGFKRMTGNTPDKGAYYHELFLRGRPYLGYKIRRVRIKGIGVRAASNPGAEPAFYQMPYCFGDGSIPADAELHAVAKPAPIDPKDAVVTEPDNDKDPPAEIKKDPSSCYAESEPPALERTSPLPSPEISPPPSPTTMSEKPLSELPEKRKPIKKRKPVKASAKQTNSRKKEKKTATSQKKNVCINPVTMQIIPDDVSSLAEFESTIRPLGADKVASLAAQQDDGIDEVSFCGCHFHYMGHLNRDALNEIEAFHPPPELIAIPESLASVNADMDVPYLAPDMLSSLAVPVAATTGTNQITPSSSTEQIPLCIQCGGMKPPFASGEMAEPNWPTIQTPVLSRHVSFEDHEHDGDYNVDGEEQIIKGLAKAESKKVVAEYSEPHRSAKEEMEHFFETLDLPYDWLSDRDIEEHEMMNLDSDEKLAAALEEAIN